MPRALYLHVPFCPHVCPYCDFHKMRRHEGLVKGYLERLVEEAQTLHSCYPGTLETIYFGGGTPSHLSDEELGGIVRTFEGTWGFPATQETTLEADPLTFDERRLERFRDLGFNRLSIGLQSTQDEVLQFLGRKHSGSEGLRAVEMALAAGFNVSADLITAVPGQDAARDLHTLAQTGVGHVSVYNLTVEPYTPFARRGVKVDPDKEADDYGLADEILSSYGLRRYEVSSHARPGSESRHNQVYWYGDYFLALGPSAASFLPSDNPDLIGERHINPPIKDWLQAAPPEVLEIDPQAYLEDMLMTGLRTLRGVDLSRVEARTGLDPLEHYRPLIKRYEEAGLLVVESGHLRATGEGLLRLNGMLEGFFRRR